MKRKFLACALIATSVVSAAAFAGCGLFGGKDDGGVEQDNLRFELKEDGTYELTSCDIAYIDDGAGNVYTGEGETVNVPETVNGIAVTSVSSFVFSDKAVNSVTLPDSITEMGDCVFLSCTLLTGVNLPSGITSVGERTFYNCEKLATLNLPATVTKIGERAFAGCYALESITLPDACTVLGSECFSMSGITEIKADKVQTVSERAFWECGKLTSVNLPEVVSIGATAFYKCDALKEFSVGDKLTDFDDEAFYYTDGITKLSINSPVPDGFAADFEKLETLTLGENVTGIGESAFKGCSALGSVQLPSALSEIGDEAFAASGIKSVSVSASVKTLGKGVFKNCKQLTSLTVADGVESIGDEAFYGSGLTSLSLPVSVKTIGEEAFAGCENLASLSDIKGVTIIGDRAFACSGLTSVSFPASVKEIGVQAFNDCDSLSSVTFAEGLETIGAAAFDMKGADTLEIVLPSTVKTIGNGCFYYKSFISGGDGITAAKILINETVETVGEDVLKYCKVKELKVPVNWTSGTYESNYSKYHDDTLTTVTIFGEGTVPQNAYRYCNALKTVNLCAGVKGIGSSAFKCLEKINLDGVEYLSDSALGDLTSLNYTKIENGVKYIDNWVIASDYSQGGAQTLDLSACTGIYGGAFKKTASNDTSVLTTVIFVGSDDTSDLKFIGRYAFEGTGITAVEVPSSIVTWDAAFYECRSLSSIVIQRGVEKIADNAFSYCTNLSGLNFAATDVSEIGNSAFSGCKKLNLVTLPDGIKKIGSSAFGSCSSLLTIDLKGTEEIGGYAFSQCTSLGEVKMEAVIKIGDSAFWQCTQLVEFDLSASVTEIGSGALGYAEVVNYAGTPGQWTAIAKGGNDNSDIWSSQNDLTVNLGDGSSITLQHKKS